MYSATGKCEIWFITLLQQNRGIVIINRNWQIDNAITTLMRHATFQPCTNSIASLPYDLPAKDRGCFFQFRRFIDAARFQSDSETSSLDHHYVRHTTISNAICDFPYLLYSRIIGCKVTNRSMAPKLNAAVNTSYLKKIWWKYEKLKNVIK